MFLNSTLFLAQCVPALACGNASTCVGAHVYTGMCRCVYVQKHVAAGGHAQVLLPSHRDSLAWDSQLCYVVAISSASLIVHNTTTPALCGPEGSDLGPHICTAAPY